MNNVFVKEVAGSTLKDKYLKLNKIKIGEGSYILEINLNQNIIKSIDTYLKLKNNTNKFNLYYRCRLKYKMLKFNYKLKNVIIKNRLIGYSVIFSYDLKRNNKNLYYLKEKFEKFSINEYLCLNQMKDNLNRYIEEYKIESNTSNDKLKVIILVKNINEVDVEIIKDLNSRYKEVNIASKQKVIKSFENKIKRINDECGSCIQIFDKNKKDFREYNVCIFMDESRVCYSKYRFNKKSKFIEFINFENDKFNSNYIELQEQISNNVYWDSEIKKLYNSYGKNTVSSAIIN